MDKAAIYCRLSEEDRNKVCERDDSESIKNQKAMLTQYANEHLWEIYDIYSDDDYTGSDRSRPAFNRLLSDAEAGKFNIVLCKTQSRFTRELELVEKYIHDLFPIWGIRFVSVVDNADTSVRGNKKSRQINGLINEWYLEDMSENIKAVLTNRRKNGLFIGAFAPYGYKKDPDRKGHLIIDPEAAGVVREIFDMYISGAGRTAIARYLNERGVLSPGRYKVSNGEKYRNTSKTDKAKWRDRTVAAILKNEVYIGNLVQNKSHSISYKSKIKKPVPQCEWIRAEGTHEPIIGREIFKAAGEISESRARSKHSDRKAVNVFSGKIFCGKCGCALRTSVCNHKRYLRCGGKVCDRSSCEGTYVLYDRIYNEVLSQIRKLTCELADIELIKEHTVFTDTAEISFKNVRKNIETVRQQIKDTRNCIKRLYIDKAKNEITPEIYSELMDGFTADEAQQKDILEELEKKLVQYDDLKGRDNSELIEKNLECDSLDFEMVRLFIDRIVVYKDTGKSRSFTLEIFWNF
ncbi:MAG: recombinase family protein [Huintestinicola sp.]|uniref:recombinase family protein n=1 Tax=Huintestinicola sp. TaxID=2981661 RepID=UPI003F12C12A